MGKKWARLAREQVGYGLVGRDARATVTSSTGETVTRGPIQGVRVEEKPDRFKLPDFKTCEQPTYVKVEVQINGEWFLVSKVEVKRGEGKKPGFKPGGVIIDHWSTGDQVEAAVERALRRQQSKTAHPSSGLA